MIKIFGDHDYFGTVFAELFRNLPVLMGSSL